MVGLNMLVELLYSSVAVAPHLTNVDLDGILLSARRRNVALGITGILLYYRGQFVQILEGRKALVDDIYQNHINPDTRHTGLNKVLENTIAHRSFSEWSMGLVSSKEIESLMPLSISEIIKNMLTKEAKNQPLSLGVNGFISIYSQMHKSPYR
jgi:hypothetical protein